MIQNVIPANREPVAYEDDAPANDRCRAIMAGARLACMRSELLAVQAQLDYSAASARRHGCVAIADAYGDAATLIRDAVGRAGE